MNLAKKYIVTAISVIVIGILVTSACFYANWVYSPVFIGGKPVPFEIQQGGNAKNVTDQLIAQEVPINDTFFSVLVRISGNSSSMRAGPYELKAGDTPAILLKKITHGIFALESLTIVEGWSFHRIRRIISKHDGLRHDTIHLSEKELLRKLNITYRDAEGLFFPDTYLFRKGASDIQIYRRAHEAQMTRLAALWKNRDLKLPYKKPYDALIMASIIEKETADPNDRNMISGVFVNRMKIGMPLQTDPTVIYGMGKAYKGKIRKIDLQTDTPYNTYTRYGLPPTPIAMPGNGSLEAAFQPANTNALYFVARGDGSSQFSSNLKEHNQAVNKYLR